MGTILQNLPKEDQISAVMQTVHQAIIAKADSKFIERYISAKKTTTDSADRMRIDIAFSDKLQELRQADFFSTPAKDLRTMAQKIVEENDPEMWFGKATQLAVSLIGK